MILKEAQRLYDLGWAVHWIKPNSKAPVKAGWSGPQRDSMDDLLLTYREGYGLGVRMGESSRLADGSGYLANIDIDIKSSDTRHKKEALGKLNELFPEAYKSAPVVKTGYGYRFFVKTETPVKSGKITASNETCRVRMPTAPVSAQQRKLLTPEELKAGWRVRPAWELDFMSAGRQVVLPPSIHPETGKPYVWLTPEDREIPLVEWAGFNPVKTGLEAVNGGFKPVNVDLVSSSLPDRIVDMILSGDGVEDRSAALLPVAIAMLRARFSEDEILSVLTDKDTFLGETAYEHAKTRDRARAAEWVRKYTLVKAREEVDAARAFADEVEVSPVLADEGAVKKQTAELVALTDWRLRIQRTGKDGDGPPKQTLENTVLILQNAVAFDVFKRDLFANRDAYTLDTPWGGKAGAALTDDDAIRIKHWLAVNYRFEPSIGTVYEAMTVISLENGFHPIRDELRALPLWDGVPRIDTWLTKYFGAHGPKEYLAQVFRKWLVASVARIYEPGLKFDWMPILEGGQGTGKSSFGAILFGQKYFADWLPELSDKDAALGLQGKRCIEFGELDSLRRNEVETIKAFVTRQVDNVRPPYGRRSVEIYRQVVFFGTTNKEEYLIDETGNRRFNPMRVGMLDFDALARDREQLWAEALFVYQNGLETTLYLEGEANTFAEQIQNEKMVSDESTFMAEQLAKCKAGKGPESIGEAFNFGKFRLINLFEEGTGPLRKWQETGRNIKFAAKALKSVGAEKWKSDGNIWWKWGPRDRVGTEK